MVHGADTLSAIGLSRPGDLVTEDELIDRCRRGDRSAFDLLMERHYPTIYDVARRLLTNRDDAADVAQEVFIAAWEQLPRFQPRASLRTWLHAITVRRCARCVRGARSRPASLDRADLPEPRAPDAISVEDQVERNELDEALHAAIHRLSRAQREAIVLHYFGDLTCAETAAVMGVSTGTVMTHLFRARASLHKALRGRIDEELLP